VEAIAEKRVFAIVASAGDAVSMSQPPWQVPGIELGNRARPARSKSGASRRLLPHYSTEQRERFGVLAGEALLAIDDPSMAALAARPMTFVETIREADRAHTEWCKEVGIAMVGRPESDAEFVRMWVEEVRKGSGTGGG
jgi:hypothetical protein